jgi:hypothetical protein
MQNDEIRNQIIQQLQKIEDKHFLQYLYILICEMVSKRSK